MVIGWQKWWARLLLIIPRNHVFQIDFYPTAQRKRFLLLDSLGLDLKVRIILTLVL